MQNYRKILTLLIVLSLSLLNLKPLFALTGWSDNYRVIVRSSALNGDLSNFPVYLNLNDLGSNFFSTVNGTGADIRVTQGDGLTEVPFELVEIDTVNGEGELWFKAPFLSASSDTEFQVWSGNGDAVAYADTDTYGTHNVWTQGYVAVYHFNEDPDGGAGSIIDSTSSGDDGTPSNMTAEDPVQCKLGKCLDYDDTDSESISTTEPNVDIGTGGDTAFSFSTWFKTSGAGGFDGIYLYLRQTNRHGLMVRRGSFTSKLNATYSVDYSGVTLTSSSDINDGKWHYFNFTQENISSRELHIDGSVEVTNGRTMVPTGGNAFSSSTIGATAGGEHWDDQIDEFRMSNEFRTIDWSKAEYDNQNNPPSFYKTLLTDPRNIAGLYAWWDASDASTITSDINGRVSIWDDKSGNGNNGSQATYSSQPLTGTQTLNSLNVFEFDADNEYFSVPSTSSSRTVFAVLYEDGSNPRNDFLGHSGGNSNRSYVRDSNPGFLWGSTGNPEYTNSNVTSGTTRINSLNIGSGQSYFPPRDEAFIISNLSTGGVWIDQIARGKTSSSTTWRGNIAEILVYTSALSNREIAEIEDYLADKWAIDTELRLVSTYPADNSDLNSTNNADHLIMNFNRDVEVGNGSVSLYLNGGTLVETIDINNGSTVSTNSRNEVTIQLNSAMTAGNSYYVQMDPGVIIDLDDNDFAGISNDTDWDFEISSYSFSINGLIGWWDAADTDTLTLDVNGRVSYWRDKSGDNKDAIQTSPTARALSGTTTLNNLNTLFFDADGESYRTFENIPNVRSAFMIMKEESGTGPNELIGSFYQYSNSYEGYRRDGLPGYIWGSTGHPEYVSSYVTAGTTRLNSVTVDGQSSYLPEDEFFLLSNTATGNVPTNLIGQRNTTTSTTWRGEIAEILLYDYALSASEVGEVEDYLTAKWGLNIVTDMFLENEFPPDNGALISPRTDSIKLFLSKDSLIQNGDLDIYQANGNIFETIDVNNGTTVSGDGTDTIIFQLSRSFEQGASYYVNFDNGMISDLAGDHFDELTGTTAWNFTIAPGYDFDIDSLIGWWDAADTPLLETDLNGRVSYWNDKSGNNRPASQDDSTDRVLTGITTQNGLNTVFFDADDQAMTFEQNLNNRTAIFVMKKESGTGSNEFFNHSDQQNNTLESYSVDNSTFIWGSTGHPEYTHNSVLTGTTKVNSFTVDGQSTPFPEDRHFLFSNRSANVPADQIGRESSQANTWRGEMAEIVTYSKSLTAKELSRVEAYLADKWGFRLNYTSLDPVDEKQDVLTIDNFTINFDEAVNTQAADLLIYQANGSIFETVDMSNGSLVTGVGTSSITVNPVNDLVAEQDYYIHIEGGAFVDVANGSKAFTGLYENGEWNFHTIEPFDSNGWSNSHRITILASQLNGDLYNYPVYLDISHLPTTFFSIVNGDGADIRMTQADQLREVAFELVDIDTANGTGELYFKAPYLSSTINTDFYLWYGNGDALAYAETDKYGSQNVWTQGYLAVYHLNENGNTADNGYKDSTANNFDANGINMTNDSDVDGVLGKAQDFNGIDEYLNTYTPFMSGLTKSTVSFWYQADSFSNSQSIFHESIYYQDSLTLSNRQNIVVRDSLTGQINPLFQYVGPLITGTWYFSAVTIDADADSHAYYLDGVRELTSTVAIVDIDAHAQSGLIGGQGNYHDGLIDEVRISNESRTIDWMQAVYANQSSAEDFYLIDGKRPNQEDTQIFWFTIP